MAELTEEQKLIVEKGAEGKNIVVQAYAGCAKTTALLALAEERAKAVPRGKGLILAFNTRAAAELRSRINPKAAKHWDIKTFNSLGHSILLMNRGKFGGKIELVPNKVRNLVSELRNILVRKGRTIREEELETRRKARNAQLETKFLDCYDTWRELEELTIQAKTFGVMPYKFECSDFELSEPLSFLASKIIADAVNALLNGSLLMARKEGKIDFSDQILLSALLCPNIPSHWHTVLVDEAQDCSGLNNLLIKKAGANASKVFVGDRFQTLYQWRGAVFNNLEAMAKEYEAETLKLSRTFRCPVSITKLASSVIERKDFKTYSKEKGTIMFPYAPSASSGRRGWRAKNIVKENTVILARTNEDCYKFLAVCLLEGIKPEDVVLNTDSPKHRTRFSGGAFLSKSLSDNDLKKVMEEKGNKAVISTIHRFKGLERERVFLFNIQPDTKRINEYYVGITRAKKLLGYLFPEYCLSPKAKSLFSGVKTGGKRTGDYLREREKFNAPF